MIDPQLFTPAFEDGLVAARPHARHERKCSDTRQVRYPLGVAVRGPLNAAQ
jgi:hypothetical protein